MGRGRGSASDISTNGKEELMLRKCTSVSLNSLPDNPRFVLWRTIQRGAMNQDEAALIKGQLASLSPLPEAVGIITSLLPAVNMHSAGFIWLVLIFCVCFWTKNPLNICKAPVNTMFHLLPLNCTSPSFSSLSLQSLDEVKEKVEGGYRMQAPEDCPPGVYSLMRICWEREPRRRPTFHKLREKLEQQMGEHKPDPEPKDVDGDGSGSGCWSLNPAVADKYRGHSDSLNCTWWILALPNGVP